MFCSSHLHWQDFQECLFGGNASNSGDSKGSFKHRTLNKIDSIGCCMTQVYAPMLCDVNWDYCNQLKIERCLICVMPCSNKSAVREKHFLF
jgi:hypothetical protein